MRLQELVAEHQERRAGATDEVVQEFWRIRKLKYDYPDPPKVITLEPISKKINFLLFKSFLQI